MRDAVVDGVTGFLVGQDDVASLATRMGQLLGDQNIRDEMGREARPLILKAFLSSIQAERFSALHAEVISRRGRLPK
jgi:glycosyltransferase involved in cell wall biosynthesis